MAVGLNATELRVINNLTQALNPTVFLGDEVQSIFTFLPRFGTPKNAVAARATLSIGGVVVHGETVAIDNPVRAGVDVYEFLADAAQTKSAASNIGVDISAHTTKSFGTLTMDTQPTSGDKVTIGEKVFTFVPVGTDTADGEVSIGESLAEAQSAFVSAVNGTDGINIPHPLVSAAEFSDDDCVVTALIGGVAGDSIDTETSFTALTNAFAAAKLGSGADCSAANAVTALVAAVTASDTQKVGAADGDGNTVVFSADVGGASGNDIIVDEDMANGGFVDSVVKLSGGVDATVSDGLAIMCDASYLYICVAANTVANSNWRRVSITSF